MKMNDKICHVTYVHEPASSLPKRRATLSLIARSLVASPDRVSFDSVQRPSLSSRLTEFLSDLRRTYLPTQVDLRPRDQSLPEVPPLARLLAQRHPRNEDHAVLQDPQRIRTRVSHHARTNHDPAAKEAEPRRTKQNARHSDLAGEQLDAFVTLTRVHLGHFGEERADQPCRGQRRTER